jgi:hypothetical protein
VFEWSLEDERVRRLSAHAAREELTAEQLARYQRLMSLVDQNQHIVVRLIDG